MRAEGWERLLNAYLARNPAFSWGEDDCATWSARWVREATGRDFLADWEGRYTSERGAAALMLRRGFAGVAAIADAALPSLPVPFAGRGDLVLHPHGPLGICDGRLSHFLAAEGMTSVDTLCCVKAWKV